jgi:GrpB-like predicted nucleotidyltransferase (UPF0157 family)
VPGPGLTIGAYELRSASCRPWDARAPEVAARVAALIGTVLPAARVEHIGSTSVPGCSGKGIVDLLLLYPPGGLAAARDALAGLGFQPQPGRDPWPEERPMRVGSVSHNGDRFALHVHVVAGGSAEEAWDVRFRDRLRADPALVDAYVARKREIIGAGVIDSVEYSLAKGPFIEGVMGFRAPGQP